METDFEALEIKMHRDADERAGDVIQLMIPPAEVFTDVKGYVLKTDAPYDPAAVIDPLEQIQRVKLRKELLPEPNRDVRISAVKLGAGTYQIAGDVDDGVSHWLFDVQLVDDD